MFMLNDNASIFVAVSIEYVISPICIAGLIELLNVLTVWPEMSILNCNVGLLLTDSVLTVWPLTTKPNDIEGSRLTLSVFEVLPDIDKSNCSDGSFEIDSVLTT